MSVTMLLIEQILALFLIMACGLILVKVGLVKATDSKILSMILVYIVCPCTMINAFQIDFTPEVRDGFILAIVAGVAVSAILFVVNLIYAKIFKLDPVEKCSILYSNAGNLVIPLVTAVLGAEWVIFASAFMCVQLTMLWTHGNSVMQGKGGFQWKKILLNPNVIAIVIGLILFFAKIELPSLIGTTLSSIASLIGPLNMIMLGMLMAAVKWKEVFSSNRIYIVTFLKMIVSPLIILVFLKFSGLASFVPDGKTILLITLLAIITPSASTVTQQAQLHNQNPTYASAINVFTTVVGIVTMPIMIALYMM